MLRERYARHAIVMHWLIAGLMVITGVLGILHEAWPEHSRAFWLNLHALAGVALWLALLLRIGFKLNEAAGPASTLARRAVHLLLYVMLFLTSLLGAVAFIRPGLSAEDVHAYLAYGGFALAGLHTATALWHQFIKRDGLLRRMWPLLCIVLVAVVHADAQTVAPEEPRGWMRWFDGSTLPFIPVPEIDVDPNSGTTLGLIPTWISTDDKDQVRKIIAPDVIYNPNFGVGARGRMYSFTSEDTQWSVVAGAKQHVESEFDYEYETGRLRDTAWSFNASVIYDRSGTPRFYGVGNASLRANESNYTFRQKYVQSNVGWNLSRILQIAYLFRARAVDVEPGTLMNIPSTTSRFAGLTGLGIAHEALNRIALIVDTRDDTIVPTQGGRYSLFAGVAAGDGAFGSSLYSVAGADVRQIWTLSQTNIIAAHAALRYLSGTTDVPFWALSSIGGDQSILGETQPLRGFGAGRFYDRNSFSASVEYRKRVLSIDAVSTHINIEITPFYEVGEVFAHSRASPVSHLHQVAGVGFRGVANPFVVGYVDIGYGGEGAAVFTGINYPF